GVRTPRWGPSLRPIRTMMTVRPPTIGRAIWTQPSHTPGKTILPRIQSMFLRTTRAFSFPGPPPQPLRERAHPRHQSRKCQRPVSADPKRACQYRRLRRRNYLKNPPRTIGFKRKFAPTSLAVGRKNTFLRLVGLGLAETTGAEMIGAEVVAGGGLPEAGRASADPVLA